MVFRFIFDLKFATILVCSRLVCSDSVHTRHMQHNTPRIGFSLSGILPTTPSLLQIHLQPHSFIPHAHTWYVYVRMQINWCKWENCARWSHPSSQSIDFDFGSGKRLWLLGWIVNVFGVRTPCRVAHRINLLEYSWPKSACYALWNWKSVEHITCNDRSWSASHRYSNCDAREKERQKRKIDKNRQVQWQMARESMRNEMEKTRFSHWLQLVVARRVHNSTQNNFYFLFQCARPINSNRVIIAENLSD